MIVEFPRVGDQFRHRIGVTTDGHDSFVLTSQEPDEQQLWPPAPPIQEIHIERPTEDRQLALIVGSTSSAHWSISVELHSISRSIVFDIACRVRQPPARLQCGYELLIPPCDTNSGSLAIEVDPRVLLIGGFSRDGKTTADWTFDESCLVIRPPKGLLASISGDATPRTICWRYQFHLVDR